MSNDLQYDIPIWPGSSSFVPGDTPFGFYDTDSHFQNDADKVALYCARNLGYPIIDIELQDVNFYASFEEAITEYSNQVNQFNAMDYMLTLQGQPTSSNLSQKEIVPSFKRIARISDQYATEAGVGGNITLYSGSIDIVKSRQSYDFEEFATANGISGDIEIRRIFHENPPAIVRYFDPYAGTGLGASQMLSQFGWGGFSPGISFMLMPMYADLLRLQAIEMNDAIRRSQYSFDLVNNKLRIFPVPSYDFKLFFHYLKKSDRNNANTAKDGVISDLSNIPYDNISYQNINHIGRQWIRRYTLALCKETLGFIRSKYQSIPFANNEEVALDGDALRSEAQQERENLITQLRETLEQLSQENLTTKRATISDNVQKEMLNIPLPFFVK